MEKCYAIFPENERVQCYYIFSVNLLNGLVRVLSKINLINFKWEKVFYFILSISEQSHSVEYFFFSKSARYSGI